MRSDRTGPLSWVPEVIWLTLVWLLLWASVSPLVLLGAFAFAVAAMWVSRLPPQAPFAGRLRPLSFVTYLVDFVGEMFSSAVQVSWQAVRYGEPAGSAIVAVPVRAHSSGLLVVMANSVSLTPGTVVVDYDAERGRLLVHGFPVRSHGEAEDLRHFALRIEERVVRAIGSPEDLQAIEREERR